MSTLVILSDTHGDLHPSIEAMAQQADYVAHAGDVCGSSILKRCQPKQRLYVVSGNNDCYCHDEYIANAELRFEIDGLKLAMEHGHRLTPERSIEQALFAKYADADVIIYGHSHQLRVQQLGHVMVLNPGAAGETRTNGHSSCLWLRIVDGKVDEIHAHQFPHTVNATSAKLKRLHINGLA